MRLHDSVLVRQLYLAAGFVFVGVAVLGLILPVLPATPFVLLAAACFVRGSARCYNSLIEHRLFGPTVREWHQHRS